MWKRKPIGGLAGGGHGVRSSLIKVISMKCDFPGVTQSVLQVFWERVEYRVAYRDTMAKSIWTHVRLKLRCLNSIVQICLTFNRTFVQFLCFMCIFKSFLDFFLLVSYGLQLETSKNSKKLFSCFELYSSVDLFLYIWCLAYSIVVFHDYINE